MMVSIFKHKKDVYGRPKYSEADSVLESIRLCKLQQQIDTIRAESDSERRRELKGLLPNICFAGKFTNRTDKGLVEHSGLAILDIDHIGTAEQVEAEKEKLKSVSYIYSCFVSPSGDGLKVLVRIPADKEKHRAHYSALMKIFPQSDETSINESRVCYASADANIYINKNAVEFTEVADVVKKEKINYPTVKAKATDYFRLGVAAKMIAECADGEKHKYLLRASKLLGGYIATGIVDESDAIHTLESEIQRRDIVDFDGAKKTIRDGIEYGKNHPIFETEEFKAYKQNGKPAMAESQVRDYVATSDETNSYITQIRDGTFEMGKSTGLPTLDEHWVFKEATLVVVNGHDNVGKSVLMWYLATLSCILHGWKWIIYSNENKTGGIKKKIIEFYKCKSISSYSDSELQAAYEWFDDNFTIIKNTELFTYSDMLQMGRELNETKQYRGFLIDPYNSLWRETQDTHEYDYKAMTEFRQFISQTKCSIYLNCHAITEALRRKYSKEHPFAGFPMPPDKADTEGGGKFSNKADDFLTIHRMMQHPDEWMWTEIHVKKIKEMETGGKHTHLESPVKIRMTRGSLGFEDINGFNPILDHQPIQTKMEMPPNPHPDSFTEPIRSISEMDSSEEMPF